jgi:hypothetical protein
MVWLCLLLLTTFGWALLIYATLLWQGVELHRRGLPLVGGTSIAPTLPFFPLASCGIAYVIDRFDAPWGIRIVGILHIVLSLVCLVLIARAWWILGSSRRAA